MRQVVWSPRRKIHRRAHTHKYAQTITHTRYDDPAKHNHNSTRYSSKMCGKHNDLREKAHTTRTNTHSHVAKAFNVVPSTVHYTMRGAFRFAMDLGGCHGEGVDVEAR